MVQDRDALVAELTGPAAVRGIWGLCTGALLLSRDRLLLTTSSAKEAWESALTEMAARDPEDCVNKVQWRQSARARRMWVKPHRLDRDGRSARARARPEEGLEDPRAAFLIQLRGGLGPDPNALLEALMAAVASESDTGLTRGRPGRVLQTGQWLELQGAAGRWQGSVRVQARSLEDARALATKLRTFMVNVGGECRALEVHSPHIPDWDADHPAAGAGTAASAAGASSGAGFPAPGPGTGAG